MKRVSKWFVLFTVAVLSAVGFTACGDDDDDVPSDSGIVGKWKLINIKGYETGVNIHQWDQDVDSDKEWMEFCKDGSWTITEYEAKYSGTWNLSGNQLTIKEYEDGELITDVATVMVLNATTLVVSTTERWSENGVACVYYQENTYQRVKN